MVIGRWRYGVGVLSLASSGISLGCQALADPGTFEYLACVRPRSEPYVELFEGEPQELFDRCWQRDNLPSTAIRSGPSVDDELVFSPTSRNAGWSDSSEVRAPILFREISGNFAVFLRVEAAQGISDACLASEDQAGLVIRSADHGQWATFLTQPDLTDHAATECLDTDTPLVRAIAQSHGFDDMFSGDAIGQIGLDGEADIAICRWNETLSYYYRHWDDVEPAWAALESHVVSTEPLDVGVTTTTSAREGVEGHFPWIVFQEVLPADNCNGAMEEFTVPETQP